MLLAHPLSVAHGLNMQQGGANVFWYSLSPSLEDFEQLNARLNRQGQQRQVVMHIPMFRNSIDVICFKIVEGRASEQNSFFELLKTEI